MSTIIDTTTVGGPYPLGKLSPGADFGTLSVPLTANFVFKRGSPARVGVLFDAVQIRAGSDNDGLIYICNSAAAPDTSAYSNVLDVLTAGEAWPRQSNAGYRASIANLHIGAANANDFAFGYVTPA